MASTRKRTERYQITPEAAIAGILALQVDVRESRIADEKGAVKAEVLLSIAGLSIEGAAVTGKKYDTVRMAIQRGRRK